MSRTLFAYIFKDLFRIFLMASGALAGIMSFGGLLRPLTREGLDAGQVARMLTYFGPAMTTYSFPVAALFATAVVYGRLSADNELTACKAGGISLLSLTVSGPALVLGLIVAITSLLFLCFLVPASTLRVEKVIYSNLAKLVQGRIERNHEIDLPETTIFAQDAHVLPPGPNGQQRVELILPTVISVERDADDKTMPVAKEFYTASRAWVYIDPEPNGQEVNVTVDLRGGFKFPRRYTGGSEASVQNLQYGPTQFPSPIKEDVKFMSVEQLKELYADVSKSRKLQGIIADFVKTAQKNSFLENMAADLNGADHVTRFMFENEGSYSIAVEGSAYAASLGGELVAPYRAPPKKGAATAPATAPDTQPVERPIVFRRVEHGQETQRVQAASAVVKVRPVNENGLSVMDVTIELRDCHQRISGEGGEIPRNTYPVSTFEVPMNAAQRAMAGRSIAFYESPAARALGNQVALTHDKTQLVNMIITESNGRASFAVSCLILVMVGSALGMMFRSGNFLTAFAVSFVPALLSITLIIAGQRVAGNVPFRVDQPAGPLRLGLALIWSGNGINLLLAIGLLWKLGRR